MVGREDGGGQHRQWRETAGDAHNRAPRVMRLVLIGTVVAVFGSAGLGWTLVRLAEFSRVEFLGDLVATLNPGFLVALPAAVVLGLAFTVSRVGARTVLTETAPTRTQGNIFAVQGAGARRRSRHRHLAEVAPVVRGIREQRVDPNASLGPNEDLVPTAARLGRLLRLLRLRAVEGRSLRRKIMAPHRLDTSGR